jgi:hypothetical protein
VDEIEEFGEEELMQIHSLHTEREMVEAERAAAGSSSTGLSNPFLVFALFDDCRSSRLGRKTSCGLAYRRAGHFSRNRGARNRTSPS